MPSGGGSESMTFTINKRLALSLVAVLAITLAAGAVGYLVGQSSRQSEDAVALLVNQRVTEANEATNAERDIAETKAIKLAVTKAVKKAKKAQYRKDQKRWKAYSTKLIAKAEDRGYAAGNRTGYNAGHSAGFSKGEEEGEAQGYSEGFDEAYDFCEDDDGYFC
jgi:hypothetical protein